MTERRYKILAVNPEFLIDYFQGRPLTLVSPVLPKDARMVGLGRSKEFWMFDPQYVEILIIVESAEFDPVPEGSVIPYLDRPMLKI